MQHVAEQFGASRRTSGLYGLPHATLRASRERRPMLIDGAQEDGFRTSA